MFNNSFILPLVALFIASACGDDPVNLDLKKEDSSVRSRDSELASAKDKDRDGDQVASTGAFDRKLSGLVTRAAPWGDVEIRVEGARLQRGNKPANFPSHVVFTSKAVYAVLELQLEARGESATDYRERNTWDLLLADGTRVSSLNPVGELLEPGDRPTVSLFYQVEDAANLRGAAVEINGSERDVLEPLRIPLDEKRDFESQVELRNLVGESFDADDGKELTLEIVDAVYGVNLLSTGRRAPLDQRLVQLTVRASNTGDSSLSFDTREDGPRISLDDDSIVADDAQVEKIKSGATREFVMVYAIDEAVRQFDLVFELDDEAESCVSVELPPLVADADADADAASDSDSASDSEDAADSSDESDSDDEVDSSDDSDSDDEVDSNDDSSDDEVDSSDDADSGDEADSDDDSSSEDGSNSDQDDEDGAGDDFDPGVN